MKMHKNMLPISHFEHKKFSECQNQMNTLYFIGLSALSREKEILYTLVFSFEFINE